jgi:hypothetical protein
MIITANLLNSCTYKYYIAPNDACDKMNMVISK